MFANAYSRSRVLGGLLVLVFLAGCSTRPPAPPTPREESAVWLSEAHRTLALRIGSDLPDAEFRSRDHKVGKRVLYGAGGGVVGAGGIIVQGCVSGGPVGCLVGLVLSPIGLVAGAAGGAMGVKSEDTFHDLDDVKGTVDLVAETKTGLDLKSLVTDAMDAAARETRKHRFLSADAGADGRQDVPEGELELAVTTFGMLGDIGENPSVGLILGGTAHLRTPQISNHVLEDYTYEGDKRPLSDWRAADARLFRQEIARAVRAWADSVMGKLAERPSEAAVSKVLAQRERLKIERMERAQEPDSLPARVDAQR